MLPPLSALRLDKTSWSDRQTDVAAVRNLMETAHGNAGRPVEWKLHMAAMLIASYLYTEGVGKTDQHDHKDKMTRQQRQNGLFQWLKQLGYTMENDSWITVFDYYSVLELERANILKSNIQLVQVAMVDLYVGETPSVQNKRTLMVFTGTRDSENLWLSHLTALFQSTDFYKAYLAGDASVHVRRSTNSEWERIFNSKQNVGHHLKDLFDNHAPTLVAGHSLGGGLATAFMQIYTKDMEANLRPKVVTFGSPITTKEAMDLHYVTNVPGRIMKRFTTNIFGMDPASVLNKNFNLDNVVLLEETDYISMDPTAIHLCYAYVLGLASLFLKNSDAVNLSLLENKFLVDLLYTLRGKRPTLGCGYLFLEYPVVLDLEGGGLADLHSPSLLGVPD